MTAQEIKEKFEAEQVTLIQFLFEELRPDWLGKVEQVKYEHHPDSIDELENETGIFYLPDHDVRLRISGTKEDGRWEFYYFGVKDV